MAKIEHTEEERDAQVPIVDYVLEKVEKYEDLNAKDLAGSERRFTKQLRSSLEKQNVDHDRTKEGGVSSVLWPEDYKGIVIKTIHPEHLEQFQQEYQMLVKYFGHKFVPYTRFTNVNNPNISSEEHPNEEGTIDICIQEELQGTDIKEFFNTDGKYKDLKETYPLIHEGLIEFIKRYRVMQNEAHLSPDDQVFIDLATNEISIYDINYLNNVEYILSGNRGLNATFWEQYDPTINSESSLSQIWQSIYQILVKEKVVDAKKGFETFMTDMTTKESRFLRAKAYTRFNQSSDFGEEIDAILSMLRYFSLIGDNYFIQQIKETFGVEV